MEWGTEPYLISIGRHVTITNRVVFITHDGGTSVVRGQDRYRRTIRYGRIDILDNSFIGHSSYPDAGHHHRAELHRGGGIRRDPIRAARQCRRWRSGPGIRSIDEYAEKLLESTPAYDEAAYRADKQRELLRLYPRP